MISRLWSTVLLFGALACGDTTSPSSPAAGDGTTASYRAPTRAGLFVVEARPLPDPIPLNEPFHLDLRLFEADGTSPVAGAQLEVDGWMENHGHGMVRRSVVVEISPGRYEVRGMLFHMGGHWDLRVEASRVRLDGEYLAVERDGTSFGVDL